MRFLGVNIQTDRQDINSSEDIFEDILRRMSASAFTALLNIGS